MIVNRFLIVIVFNCIFICILVLILIVGNILFSLYSVVVFEGIYELGRIFYGYQEYVNSLCIFYIGILIIFIEYFFLYFLINMIVMFNFIEIDSVEIDKVQF